MKYLYEFWLFGLKQASACVFGGFLLFIMIGSHFWYPITSLHRYDFIFLSAVLFQILLLVFRLETTKEALVIILFHLVATVMELFKTSDSIQSWHYPESYQFGIGNVPLFTGFMYSAVGSYIARAWRIFEFQFSNYPPVKLTIILSLAIYINFFTHHFFYDLRWILLLFISFFFWKTDIHFKIIKTPRKMPLLLGWFLVALFIWIAENIATFVNIWKYPDQNTSWQLVSYSKLISWFLLMIISFVLVSLIKSYQQNTRQ